MQTNAKAYDKGILAEILEPIMGKGLIPADPETWKVRRRAIVPGFHKAWCVNMGLLRELYYISVWLICVLLLIGTLQSLDLALSSTLSFSLWHIA